MDKRSELLLAFSQKEQSLKLFDHSIDGIFVYGFLCRELRHQFLSKYDVSLDRDTIIKKKKKSVRFAIVSFFQLLLLYLKGNDIDTFIYSFYRVDRISDLYLDKFTDPLIEFSSIKDSYIIFEKSNNYQHKRPRVHSEKVVYTDFIEQQAIKFAQKNKAGFISRHYSELESLWKKLDILMDGVGYNKDWAVTRLLRDQYLMRFYDGFFTRHSIKRFLAPCRAAFLPQMYVCKDLNIPVFELQHGVNFGMDSITCIGYFNNHFVPDYFLSYGEIQHCKRYGMEHDRIVNIGWAFSDYVRNQLSSRKALPNHVLVITNNLSIHSIFKFIGLLAADFPSIAFDIRLHPLATMTEYAQQIVNNNRNVTILDNSINIAIELDKYEMVIGDNSTVLAEALNYEKKVGKVLFENMIPKYSSEEEKRAVWEISDSASFNTFVQSAHKAYSGFRVYSPFNLNLFESILALS